MPQYFVLAGILIVVVGFALRLNPLLVVTVAALATGLIAGKGLIEVISPARQGVQRQSRHRPIVWIVLPVIGLLERYGLQERAAAT